MLIRIRHRTAYIYNHPVSSVIELLRLTPREYNGLRVRRWRIDLDHDGHLLETDDAFGNVVHILSLNRPLDSLSITVEGEVETEETSSVVAGAIERFPPGLYLRQTPLSRCDVTIGEFARDAVGNLAPLDAMHALLTAVHNEVRFDLGSTDTATTAIESFKAKQGVCQDLAHIFIAAARCIGVPARYIGGYLLQTDGATHRDAGHAWAEAYVPKLGWVGFDPANGISQTAAYVRVSMGLDYLGAAPIRGSRVGGSDERLDVSVVVDHAGRQQQS